MFPWYVPPPSKSSIRVGSPGDIHIVSSNTKSFHVCSSVDRSRRFDVSKIRTVFRSSNTNRRTSSTFPLRDVAFPGIPTPSHEIQCAACSNRGNCMTYLDSNWRRIVFASSPRTLACWNEAETNRVRTESTSEPILQIESLSNSTFVVRHSTMLKIHNFSSSSSSTVCTLSSKHLAVSRTCPEISLLNSNSVFLWDMMTNKYNSTGMSTTPRDEYHFISHDYAIHPRVLCLTTRRSSIVSLDLRSGRCNPLYVFFWWNLLHNITLIALHTDTKHHHRTCLGPYSHIRTIRFKS